jgi:hypothetical protein
LENTILLPGAKQRGIAEEKLVANNFVANKIVEGLRWIRIDRNSNSIVYNYAEI